MGDLNVLNQPVPYDIVKDNVVSYGDYSSRIELWRFLAGNRLALYEIFGFDLIENGHNSELIDLNPDAIDEIINFLNVQFKSQD